MNDIQKTNAIAQSGGKSTALTLAGSGWPAVIVLLAMVLLFATVLFLIPKIVKKFHRSSQAVQVVMELPHPDANFRFISAQNNSKVSEIPAQKRTTTVTLLVQFNGSHESDIITLRTYFHNGKFEDIRELKFEVHRNGDFYKLPEKEITKND